MENLTQEKYEALCDQWTDQFVRANPQRLELKRFGELVGRVVTVNWNGKAVVDFQDGGWYDIPAAEEFLICLDPADAKAKFDFKINSAQPIPEKQS